MQEVIQIVNFIKARALNSRLFSQMCSDFDSTHMHLLYHSEVRWLSRGKVLQRLLDLRTETEMFLAEKKHQLAHKFSDSNWLMQVAYLADIFAEINSLNMSMQGRDQTLVGLSEKLT
ncbi:protein FAM200A-like [Oratosquilla oratoria]|uniref:protein FAM200A-like n=1 Tax=Oratosquilla oratoria TaxID=337810 RepID=UPI003F764D68